MLGQEQFLFNLRSNASLWLSIVRIRLFPVWFSVLRAFSKVWMFSARSIFNFYKRNVRTPKNVIILLILEWNPDYYIIDLKKSRGAEIIQTGFYLDKKTGKNYLK